MKRPDFIEHSAISRLGPHLQSYALKGLKELKSEGNTFTVTALESYAASVFERVGELDNSVKSLRLALCFICNLQNTSEDTTEAYVYHYENFLLRLTGVTDRAHQLVGASLLLDPVKLRKIGANKFVSSSIAADHPEIQRCLKKFTEIASKYKTSRNEIAHSNAFSTRELGLFSAIKTLNMEVEIKELMNTYFSRGSMELGLLVSDVVGGIEELLEKLAPIYELAFNENA